MNKFLTHANLNSLISIFKNYMWDKYKFTIPDDDQSLASLTQKQIHIVSGNASGRESLQELNIQVLGYLRQFYTQKMEHQKIASTMKPSNNLDVIHNRRVVFSENLPADTSQMKYNALDFQQRVNMLSTQRNSEFTKPVPPVPHELDSQIKETPEPAVDFMQKIKEFEKERLHSVPFDASITNGRTPVTSQLNQLRVISVSEPVLAPISFKIKYCVFTFDSDGFEIIEVLRFDSGFTCMMKMSDYTVHSNGKTQVIYEPIIENDAIFKVSEEQRISVILPERCLGGKLVVFM